MCILFAEMPDVDGMVVGNIEAEPQAQAASPEEQVPLCQVENSGVEDEEQAGMKHYLMGDFWVLWDKRCAIDNSWFSFLGPSGVQPTMKKAPIVVSDSDSEDEESPVKIQGAFHSQQYPETDVQKRSGTEEESVTRGSGPWKEFYKCSSGEALQMLNYRCVKIFILNRKRENPSPSKGGPVSQLWERLPGE